MQQESTAAPVAVRYTYECYMLSGHWQKLPERRFLTREAAEKGRDDDLSYGHKCYSIEAINV